MERVAVDGVEFEVEVKGTGEPVVTIHPGTADAFAPLLAEPALSERYRLILYHRRGYAGSTRADRLLTREEHAADCVSLMQELGVERAHVVAYSVGCTIALRLVLDAPERVGSLLCSSQRRGSLISRPKR
jgi:pimeloyl-ACP methyl ester carboxylesterase